MGVHKQSVSFTEAAFAYARELVERGDYPNVSAAVSGELARALPAKGIRHCSRRRCSAASPCRWIAGNPLAALTI